MDKIAQLEELDSLKSIYYNEEFQITENSDPDGNIQTIFWAFVKLKDNYTVKYLESLDSPEPSCLIIKHLPPVELRLTLPEDYPSKNPPKFLISCQWLHKSKISLLCKKLDEIWSEYGSVEILYAWCDFLKNDSLSFLGCENELDITDLCSKHLSFIQKIQRNEMAKKKWKERKTALSKVSKENSGMEVKENSDSCENKDTNAPDSSVNMKEVNSKAYKDNQCKYGRKNPYFRRNYKNKNGNQKQNVYKNPYDERAVLNLSIKVSPIKLLENFNTEREKVEFLRNFYTCNICFSDKLGKDCTRFQDCNHIFCINCIRSYFTVKIKDGSVQSIKCPEDKCMTEALPSQVKEIVSEELFAKYDSVLLTTALDTLNDIIYCPRQICQYPVSWDPEEKMASCPNCQYVFCVSCKMVYHGIEPCQYKPREIQKLVEEYEAGSHEVRLQLENKYGKKRMEFLVNTAKTEVWIKENSKPCPKCEAAIEKSHGCNKMVCWKCNASFCWLCSALLDASDPYLHFTDPNSQCADKLFYMVFNFEEEEDDWDLVGDSDDEYSDMDLDNDYYFHYYLDHVNDYDDLLNF